MKDINTLEGFDLQAFLRDKYKDVEKVHILNPYQVEFYMTKGVYPLWTELGHGGEKIVYVFPKEITLRLFKEWRERDKNWNK